MRVLRDMVVFTVAGLLVAILGCEAQHRHSRSVAFEGPHKKTEIKVETTEKDHH